MKPFLSLFILYLFLKLGLIAFGLGIGWLLRKSDGISSKVGRRFRILAE